MQLIEYNVYYSTVTKRQEKKTYTDREATTDTNVVVQKELETEEQPEKERYT